MAFIRDSYAQTTGLSSGFTMTALPIYEIGDLLILICSSSNVATFAITTAGWVAANTFTNNNYQNNCKFAIFTKTAASLTEELPAFTCGGYNVVHALAVGDAAGIEASGLTISSANVWSMASPAVTSLTNNALIIQAAILNRVQRMRWDTSVHQNVNTASASVCMSTSFKGQYLAGAVPQENCYSNDSTGEGQTATLVIANSSGGSQTPYVTSHYPRFPGVKELGYAPTGGLNNSEWSVTGAYSLIPVFRGEAVEDFTPTWASAQVGDTFGNNASFSSSTNGIYVGFGFLLNTPVDVRNKIVSFTYAQSGNYLSSKGMNVIFASTNGAWMGFQMRYTGNNIAYTFQVSPSTEEASAVDSSGTVDWSAINRIFVLGRKNTVNNWVVYIGELLLTDMNSCIVVCGGGPKCSASDPYWIKRLTRGFTTANRFVSNGVAQGILALPIRFGNGTEPVYIDTASSSLEQPVRQLPQKGIYDYLVSDNLNGISVNACPACTVNIRQSIIASGKENKFTIADTSSPSASYSFLGQQFKNSTVKFLDGLTIDSAQFIGCSEVTGSCTYNTCGFSLQTDDYALTCASGTSLLGCSFTAPTSGSDYAVRLRTPGLYDFTDTDFINYYRDFLVDATSGDVTVKLALGQTVPSYATSGASVIWDQPVTFASFTVQGMISGSRCFVKNTTSDIVITNDIVDSSGIYQLIYTNGEVGKFTNGDTYKVIVTKYDGTSAYLEEVFTGIVSSAGATVPVAQVADSVYNVYGLNGSTFTGIVFNGVDIDIDLDGSEQPEVDWKEIYAKYVYTISTSGGIELFTGLVEATDEVNFKFSSEIVFNNLNPIPVRIGGDGYASRTDGGLMFGTGNLQINNGVGALAVNVGGSAILPSDITDIAAATKARMEETGSKLTKAEIRSRLIAARS